MSLGGSFAYFREASLRTSTHITLHLEMDPQEQADKVKVSPPRPFFLRRWFAGGINMFWPNLKGKVAVVTGGNTGIGKETARALAGCNAHVILACRDPQKTEPAVKDIQETTNNTKVEFILLDLANLASIRSFVDEVKKRGLVVDILVNNAGVMVPPFTKTVDGFELQFGVNHLGHFYLTNLLLNAKLINPNGGRIVNVSSRASESVKKIDWDNLNWEKNYSRFQSYALSKLENILFTVELHRRLRARGLNISTFAVHPGVVRTELTRYVMPHWLNSIFASTVGQIMKTPEEGAQTSLYCALAPGLEEKSGLYFADCKVREPNPLAKDPENAKKLWEISAKLVGLTETI